MKKKSIFLILFGLILSSLIIYFLYLHFYNNSTKSPLNIELEDYNNESINFAYPTQRFQKYNTMRNSNNKEKGFSNIIPGKSSYGFDNEDDYINHYSQCYYAITCKKGGWDCLRHYEIIAAGSIPYFLEIDNIPNMTMKSFPKNLVKLAMNLPGIPSENEVKKCIENDTKISINYDIFDINKYNELRKDILSHFQQKCLTKTLCNKLNPPQTLCLFSPIVKGPQDYQRDLLIISLLENGHNLTTNFSIDFIFDDYKGNTLDLYGRGMTYTKCIPNQLKNLHTISNQINNDQGMIIFSTKSNENILNINNYKIPTNTVIIELDGNDEHSVNLKKHPKTFKKFIRELNDFNIIYEFKLGYGGIGDFFKFMKFAYTYTNRNKDIFKINLSHPINKYITIKDKYISTKNTNFKIIKPFTFYGDGGKMNDDYNKIEPFLNYDFNPLDYCIISNDVYQRCAQLIDKLNFNIYDSIHVRFGDKIWDKNAREEDRIKNTDIYKKIEKISNNCNKNFILFSDNEVVKKKLAKKYHNIHILPTIVIHTDTGGSCNKDHKSLDKNPTDMLDTIAEFILLSKGQVIHAITNSGFSVTASWLNGNKIVKYY
tara:strand:- start:2966 stop:4759 length:1794 start_codon:yes stop_codon:yes gene_type:complete